jgi:serine protease Do
MVAKKVAVRLFLTGICLGAMAATLPATVPVTKVAEEVNKKLVKLYGAGGLKGLPSYGTGILVSPKGHILTANNHILSTGDLRVHLSDGRVFSGCKVLYREPELDVALLKLSGDVAGLPYFDLEAAAKRPLAETGDWILAHSNCFHIATRDEPMSVQRGMIQAYSELRARKGIFDAPFQGDAYFLDVIACNPGAAGGAVTNLKGDLLGIIGREYKSNLSDTWINYAVPIQAKAEIIRNEKSIKIDVATFVKEAIEGKYVSERPSRDKLDKGGFHGIVLVHEAIQLTPPFVEELRPESPAAKAGLRPDDLIVYVDGELVNSIKNFREVMRHYGPNDTVRLDVQRGNKLVNFKLVLEKQPKAK